MLWFCSKTTPIGVDVGGRSIKAAQLIRDRDKYKLHAAAVFPLPTPGAAFDQNTAAAFRKLLDSHGFQGRKIIVSHQGAEHVSALQSANLHIKAVDAQLSALGRACLTLMQTPGSGERATAAIADVGWTRATFAVAHGGEVLYQQPLVSGSLGDAHRAIIDRFDLPGDVAEDLLLGVYEYFATSATASPSVHATWTRTLLMRRLGELAVELKELLDHARQRYPLQLSRLLLTGGGACGRGVDAYLAMRLGIEVFSCRPSSLLECNGTPATLAQSPVLVQAIGLARWGE